MAAPRGSRRLSVAAQALALRRDHPDAAIRVGSRGLTCVLDLKPTGLSLTYRVKVSYDGARHPATSVLSPHLETFQGHSLPHVYSDGTLCLYDTGEWHVGLFITDTIVGWAVEWLAHYELWRASGQWHGDGDSPLAAPSPADA
jgi:hypothetical protein